MPAKNIACSLVLKQSRGTPLPKVMESLDRLQHSLQHAWDHVKHGKADRDTAITVAGSVAVLAGAYYLLKPKKYRKRPGASELTGGSISRDNVQKEFDDYSKAYGENPGEGITGESNSHAKLKEHLLSFTITNHLFYLFLRFDFPRRAF